MLRSLLPAVASLALALVAATLSGCSSTAGSSSQQTPGAPLLSQAAVRFAVRTSADLDQRFPLAHKTTANENSDSDIGFSYRAGAFAQGWVVEVMSLKGQLVWVVVRDGRGLVIGRGRLSESLTADQPAGLATYAVADCRHYHPCTPAGLVGCQTCGKLVDAPVTIAGDGLTLRLRSSRDVILMPLPPGRYVVSGGPFHGLRAHPRSVRLGLESQAPRSFLLGYSR